MYLDECKAGGASIHPAADGAWIAFKDADFAQGAVEFQGLVSSATGGSLEIRTGGRTGKLAGTLEIPAGSATQEWKSLSVLVGIEAGNTDVYLIFSGEVLLSRFHFSA
ncbi:Arabinoxylan arabinofuranohydrolase precursor [compost metagenome]